MKPLSEIERRTMAVLRFDLKKDFDRGLESDIRKIQAFAALYNRKIENGDELYPEEVLVYSYVIHCLRARRTLAKIGVFLIIISVLMAWCILSLLSRMG